MNEEWVEDVTPIEASHPHSVFYKVWTSVEVYAWCGRRGFRVYCNRFVCKEGRPCIGSVCLELENAMNTQEITIRVTPEAAVVYQTATEQERRKLDLLLSLQLMETSLPTRSLHQLMHEASRQAQERGLTPEILAEILDEQ